jgi:hypothetical protein
VVCNFQLCFSNNKSWLQAGSKIRFNQGQGWGGEEISIEDAQSLLISEGRFTKPSTALVPDSFLTGMPSHNLTFKAWLTFPRFRNEVGSARIVISIRTIGQ